MDQLIKDIRYALRRLAMQPLFTLVTVSTLALCIGVNTAIFSVVNAVLLRALPFSSPQQLVSINQAAASGGLPGIAAYEYLGWAEKNTSFSNVAAYGSDNFNLIGNGEPERISCAQVTASLFPLLGVQPIKGRVFLPEEDLPGHSPAAVVSESFWRRRFGSSEALVGQSIRLNDKSYTVVGIMPESFRFPRDYEIWLPLALDPQKEQQGDFFTLVEVVGRLKPGTNAEHARSDLNLISRQLADQSKERMPPATVELVPLQQHLVAGVRLSVLALWAAAGLVLLIACANVASLTLSRTISRQREMALRAAVGARRWQLVRQLLTESVLLSLLGGLLGLLIGYWGTNAIASIVPESFAGSVSDLKHLTLDLRVLSFTLLVSMLTGVLFGLAPALNGARADLNKVLRQSSSDSGVGFGWRNARGWLVVAEVALTMVLLVGAGLLVRTFNRLMRVAPGFNSENVLSLRIDLPRSTYSTPAQTSNFYEQTQERLQALPGVQSVGAINHSPLAGFGMIAFIEIEGHPKLDRKTDQPIGIGTVTPSYFNTLKIPLVSGRALDEHDTKDAAKVALVNEVFARRFFPDTGPLGKRISLGCKEGLCRQIVGVVGTIKQESLTEPDSAEVYLPSAQMPLNGMSVFVRADADPQNLIASVRNAVLSIDKEQPIYNVKTLKQRLGETTRDSRSLMLLFAAFAVLALALAVVGIFGVVSYSVNRRTHEIGIRMALGARAPDVLRLVMKSGLLLTLLGVGSGLAAALALTRFLRSLLYGVEPTDTLTYITVSALLILIALLAAYLPARRATKVDPLEALRYE